MSSQRIAALYDIHGNVPALEAVLAELRAATVDHIVVGGDVFPGPMSLDALAMLRAVTIPTSFIRGNCERDLLAARRGRGNSALPELVRRQLEWTAARLSDEDAKFLSTWPLSIRAEVGGAGNVLFCHGTPRDDNEIFTSRTPDERLLPVFENVPADVVVCGHTHIPFDRMVGRARVVNAGSVGMPFTATGAYWLLIDENISLRRTTYDVEAAASRLRASEYPGAAEFAEKYVLASPDEETMLAAMTRAQL